jgi:acetyl esterase/lipase
MDAAGGTFESNKERDVLVAREMIQNMAAAFLGENGDRHDPLANPLHGDLSGFPPVYIQVGEYETLLDDSRVGRGAAAGGR